MKFEVVILMVFEIFRVFVERKIKPSLGNERRSPVSRPISPQGKIDKALAAIEGINTQIRHDCTALYLVK